jgi:CheY-like chemotaxis protein
MSRTNDSAETKRLNAAILVARTLAHANAHTNSVSFETMERRAQYAHLLAARCRFSPLDARRAILAVWMSMMEGQPLMRRQLAEAHRLKHTLDPDDPAPESRLVALLAFCERTRKADPLFDTEPGEALAVLERQWVRYPGDKLMARRFLKLLRDDQFLHAEPAPFRGRVLMVDPDEKITPLLAPRLRRRGYHLRIAATADEARRILPDFVPDAILAHADLPMESGIDFCRQIKENATTAVIPFLVMTGQGRRHAEKIALQAGADDAVPKSADPDTLLIKLERLTVSRAVRHSEDDEDLGCVSGPLEDMPFTDMIQILTAGGKNMRILLCRDEENGDVTVYNGEVIDARLGDQTGIEAFYRLMQWREGTFAVTRIENPPPRTIEASLMSLLMEGSRRMDENV